MTATLLASLMTILTFGFPVSDLSALQRCLVEAGDNQLAQISCYKRFGHHEDPGPPGGGPSGPQDQSAYLYMWLPACTEATPDNPDAENVECASLHICSDPLELNLVLWIKQIRRADGRRVDGQWSPGDPQCRADGGTGRWRPPLTWGGVLSAVRRIKIPASKVEGPDFTLVNLDTTFYTTKHTIDRTLSIIGYQVQVKIDPSGFRWNWGDGATTSTTTAGHPYPATDITHTYVHATHDDTIPLSIDTIYTIRYRVDGGAWLTVPQTITIAGPAKNIPIKEASAVIVGD